MSFVYLATMIVVVLFYFQAKASICDNKMKVEQMLTHGVVVTKIR